MGTDGDGGDGRTMTSLFLYSGLRGEKSPARVGEREREKGKNSADFDFSFLRGSWWRWLNTPRVDYTTSKNNTNNLMNRKKGTRRQGEGEEEKRKKSTSRETRKGKKGKTIINKNTKRRSCGGHYCWSLFFLFLFGLFHLCFL